VHYYLYITAFYGCIPFNFNFTFQLTRTVKVAIASKTSQTPHPSERQTPHEILSDCFEWRLNITQTKTFVHLLTLGQTLLFHLEKKLEYLQTFKNSP
jgi:hypothetical protein